MRVLTYVLGTLTVIRDDEMFKGDYEKPSFFGGDFYYEPTLKQTLGRELSKQECSEAENYIDTFVFTTYVPKQNEVPTVDKWGNYLGVKVPLANEFEVIAPPRSGQGITWDFETNTWYESVLVSTVNGTLLGSGVNTSVDNSAYIKASLIDQTLCYDSQKYNFETKTLNVDIEVVRETKAQKILIASRKEFIDITGDLAFGEISSWELQQAEALAWSKESTVATPFIDILLITRAIEGETKEILVNKILTKSELYKSWFASHLGKVHRLQKAIETAITVDELKEIAW